LDRIAENPNEATYIKHATIGKYYYYYTCIYNARKFSNGTESEDMYTVPVLCI